MDQSLRTIPGLGAATAPAIYAEIGNIRRFTDSDQLVALAGVDPQLHESGQTAGQAKMSTRGSPYLHRAVWHAAVCPENPNLLKSLTFSSVALTLDQRAFAPTNALLRGPR